MMNKIKLILAVLVTTFCLSLFSVVFAQQKEGFFIGWSQPLLGGGDLEIDINTSNISLAQNINNIRALNNSGDPTQIALAQTNAAILAGTFGIATTDILNNDVSDTILDNYINNFIPNVSTTETPDVDFEGGYGIKAGYNFSQFRVYYSLYNLTYKDSAKYKDTAIKANLVFGDWVYKGFFVGLGYGKANFDAKSIQYNISIAGTGDVNVFNLGYDYPINENFKISGGYFIAKFNFEVDENVPNVFVDTDGNALFTFEIPTNFKIKASGNALYVDAVYTF